MDIRVRDVAYVAAHNIGIEQFRNDVAEMVAIRVAMKQPQTRNATIDAIYDALEAERLPIYAPRRRRDI